MVESQLFFSFWFCERERYRNTAELISRFSVPLNSQQHEEAYYNAAKLPSEIA